MSAFDARAHHTKSLVLALGGCPMPMLCSTFCFHALPCMSSMLTAAGGASSFPWHLSHSLPSHCPNRDGHLQGVQRAIQSLPHCESLIALLLYHACQCANASWSKHAYCAVQLGIDTSVAAHAACGEWHSVYTLLSVSLMTTCTAYNVCCAFQLCIVLTVSVVLCSSGVLCMPTSAICSRWGGME